MIPYLIGACLALGVLWIRTHKSPFVWLAIAALHAEAIRLQVADSAKAAAKHFSQNYGDRAARVRAEAMQS